MTPTRPRASSTAPAAESTMALESASMGEGWPAAGSPASWRQPAAAKAIRTMDKENDVHGSTARVYSV
ncbi:MAG: hypothetical protein MZV70_08530 [Desulfobacterales bacterium]|nr:hypothetical protein [Desulfobacterales bacterium]